MVAIYQSGETIHIGRRPRGVQVEGGGAPWWMAAGVTPVGAYAAKGAADLASSYINLANPGTNNLTAPAAAPTWDAVNGWTFNGTTQYLDTGVVPDNDRTMSMMVLFSDASATGSRCAVGAFHDGSRYVALYPTVTGADTGYANGTLLRPSAKLASGNLAFAGNRAYRDGLQEIGAISVGSGTITRSVWIGAVNAGAFVDGFPGEVQAVAIWDSVLTGYQIAVMQASMAALANSPISLPYSAVFAPADLSENGYSAAQSGYYDSSPFAYATLTTEATQLAIDVHTTIFGTFPAYTDINVRVDGADHAVVACNQAGVQTLYTTLPVGSKTVQVIAGLQSKPGATVLGTFLVGVQANAPVSVQAPSSSNRMVVCGDSISVGANSGVPSRDGWVPLLRNLRGNVMVEGWGYRALYDDSNTAPLRAAFVARLASYNPSAIWLAIGTNDYGLNKWTAAAFGTAYAALLDDLHTALPGATIYCQSPITRTVETAYGNGSTLGDYRTQISNAASARSSYCTYVDGSAWSVALDTDGVHPTTAGHSSYYAAVKAALGL